MKILVVNFLLLCVLQNINAQVSGKLTTTGGQPILHANVSLLKKLDTSLVKATVTDEKGYYRIENAEPGIYFLRFSSIGYETMDKPLFELTGGEKNKDFGIDTMKENSKQLREVVVRAEKPLFQQQTHGTVVNVESSVLTKGSSLLEVLERSPGVLIDRQNNSITLNGKTGVTVMVNGKPMRVSSEQLITLLNGMSANDISLIELLATPPSRYDAEGSGGMINIVLKKIKKKGTTGNSSITAGYGWGEKAAASIALAHNMKKIDISGSYTFSHDRSYNHLFGESSQNFPALGGQMGVLFWNTEKPVQNNHHAALGLDTRLNVKTSVGSSITFDDSQGSSHSFNRREFNVLPDSQLLFNGNITAMNRWRSMVSSLYMAKQLREGEKINFDIDYLYYKNKNPTAVQSSFVNKDGNHAGTGNDTLFSPLQKGFANTLIQVGVLKIDYVKQLSKNLKIEAGAKGTYTMSTSLSGIESLVNDIWTNRPETFNDIAMKENIGAAYSSVNTRINLKTKLVIGVRYEYAHTRIDNTKTAGTKVDRRLGVLFPGIFFSRKLTDNSELQLSYTKRISRPSYNDLSSFVAYNDPISVFTGNPLLKPTITNNLKLGYNYRGYSFSILFSRDDYPIARYQITSSPSGNLMYISPQNLTYQNNVTLQVMLPWKVTNWWDMNYSFTGGLRQFKAEYTVQPFKKTYFGYSVNISQSFKLPRKFSLEISGFYNGASYNGTVKTGGFESLHAGVKKELKNNKGIFQLSVTDLLNTLQYKNYYGTLTMEAFEGKSNVTYNPESRKSRIIKLTYSISFGNHKTKQQSGAQPNEETDRIRTQ